MQAYGNIFAKVYNRKWQDYANRIAPLILAFYEETCIGQTHKSLLDVSCGTGQLSVYFLEKGFRVVGLDLSEGMLAIARENALDYIVAQQARFVQGDAANFEFEDAFGLVVSTFDALNHLPDMKALRGCFRSSYAVLEEGGYFIFDMNTASGLKNWNSVSVDPGDEIFLLNRGFFDEGSEKAWTKITGFVRNPDGTYQRFEETVYNTVFEIQAVLDCLLETGFQQAYVARGTDLKTQLDSPEAYGKVFFITKK